MNMGMSLSQTPSMSLCQGLEVRQSLRLEQRQASLAMQTLTLRLELVGALHSGGSNGVVTYTPAARCNKCQRGLTPLEIIKGFNNDPDDFTTKCTGCGHRFQPQLAFRDRYSRGELPFYCNMQTQARIAGLATLKPEEFARKEPALYHSALVHNGTLKTAFARLNIVYNFVELTDPAVKVKPFLGRLPDTIIASVSGLKLGTIRRLRKKHSIKACTQRVMLEEAAANSN